LQLQLRDARARAPRCRRAGAALRRRHPGGVPGRGRAGAVDHALGVPRRRAQPQIDCMVGSLTNVALRVLAMMPQPVAAPGQINHAFVDPWSLAHLAVGVILSVLGVGLGGMLVITVGWELAERALKDVGPALF